MRTLVIGGGRIGCALALRAHGMGHQTQIAVRSNNVVRESTLPPAVTIIPIEAVSSQYDVIVIAAPAQRDEKRQNLITSLLQKQSHTTLIFSVVAFDGAPHAAWSTDRPYLRFLCSPAVADPQYEALVIAETEDHELGKAFADWLGPARIEFTNTSNFGRLGGLFMATIVHLETIRAFQSNFDVTDSGASFRVAAGTLTEAGALLALHVDAVTALDVCQTPGGITERLRRIVRNCLECATRVD